MCGVLYLVSVMYLHCVHQRGTRSRLVRATLEARSAQLCQSADAFGLPEGNECPHAHAVGGVGCGGEQEAAYFHAVYNPTRTFHDDPKRNRTGGSPTRGNSGAFGEDTKQKREGRIPSPIGLSVPKVYLPERNRAKGATVSPYRHHVQNAQAT